MRKKKVGIFSLTCDEGCSIFLIEIFNKKLFEWLEKMEISYFLSLKSDKEIENLDIALVEGVISTQRDKKEIEKIRKKTKILIALGNCAISGMPSGQRNFFEKEKKEKILKDLKKFQFLPEALPLKKVVKVDDQIPGCPIEEKKFLEVFEKYLK